MKVGWEDTPLWLLLRKSEESVRLEPEQEYKEVTIRIKGKGVVLRRVARGAEIASERRAVVRSGQFILSRIDARNGAFGLVPLELEGAVVSGDFPTFDVNMERLDPRFLNWFSRTGEFIDLCRAASEGSTNRVRLVESRFLQMTIPLPSLEEQKRIVARVESLMAKVDEARGLREKANTESSSMAVATRSNIFSQLSQDHPSKRFEEIAHIQLGKMLSEKSKTGTGSRSYLRNANIQWGRLDLSSIYKMDFNESELDKFLLLPNDILVCEGGNIGQSAMWSGEIQECYYQKALHRVRVDSSKYEPIYVLHHLFWNAEQKQYEDLKKQSTIAHLPLRQLKAHRMISPPLAVQRSVVHVLSQLESTLSSLSQLQTQSQLELDALPASILARAFAGEI